MRALSCCRRGTPCASAWPKSAATPVCPTYSLVQYPLMSYQEGRAVKVVLLNVALPQAQRHPRALFAERLARLGRRREKWPRGGSKSASYPASTWAPGGGERGRTSPI